eukprot:scaffold143973_cov133-Phaeocystis_antarctica.AAC.1
MCSWRGIDVCSAGSYRVPGSQMRNSFHSCIVCLVPFAYSIVVCRSPERAAASAASWRRWLWRSSPLYLGEATASARSTRLRRL